MKAGIAHRSGPVLLVPRMGLAPLLFLEFIRNIHNEQRIQRRKYRLQFEIIDNPYPESIDFFAVRLSGSAETIEAARDYINANI